MLVCFDNFFARLERELSRIHVFSLEWIKPSRFSRKSKYQPLWDEGSSQSNKTLIWRTTNERIDNRPTNLLDFFPRCSAFRRKASGGGRSWRCPSPRLGRRCHTWCQWLPEEGEPKKEERNGLMDRSEGGHHEPSRFWDSVQKPSKQIGTWGKGSVGYVCHEVQKLTWISFTNEIMQF